MREQDEQQARLGEHDAADQEKSAEQEQAEVEALRQQRLDQRAAQLAYMRGTMLSPERRAAIAFKRAGVNLSPALLAKVNAFDLQPDGAFTLRLREPTTLKLGAATLRFGTEIVGRVGRGVDFVEGVQCSAEVEQKLRDGRVKTLRAGDGEALVAETDDAVLKEVTGRLE